MKMFDRGHRPAPLVMLGLAALLAVLVPAGQASEIRRHSLQSAALAREFNYLVYIPDGYETAMAHYPVLYLLHGAGGDENSYAASGSIKETADRLIEAKAIPPTLIVMPGCSGCWWVDGAKEKAETAFWSELVPIIDKMYKTNREREGRLIAGHSAGGYGAVRFALKYPDKVAAAAALSPAVYSELPPPTSAARRHPAFRGADGSFDPAAWNRLNYTALLGGYFAQQNRVYFYLVAGDNDRLGITFETALLFKRLYEDRPSLIKLRVVDGGHGWEVWKPGIAEAMKYLYRFAVPPLMPPSNNLAASPNMAINK